MDGWMDGCEVKSEHGTSVISSSPDIFVYPFLPFFLPRYIDIDVDPCTKYVIKVLASEDYQVVIQQLSQEKKDL